MEIDAAVTAMGALAQESRLSIFRYLVQAGPEGVAAGVIGEEFGLPGATLSFHLNALKQSGLISCRRQGRSLIYVPNFKHMATLLGFLMKDCCGGQCPPPTMATKK